MAGCTVNVKSGVGWRYLTNCLTDWARYMYRSRVYLDGSSIERDSKKIAVSGLGHFGQSHTFYRMTDKDEPGLPNAITDDGRPMLHYVVPYTDYKRPAMLHWFNYFIMQTARTLYKYALPYAIDGRLVMTNYDALLIVERNERERFARKHSIESLMIDMGDLRWQELTNVKILGERSLKCDQKVIRPGVETVSVDI